MFSLLARKTQNWRWDLIGIGAGVGLLWAVTTPSSAYFLHFDAGTQDVVALALNQGCWEYPTEKYFPILLLAFVFKVLGASPLWETLILIGGAVITVASVYELTLEFTTSKIAGVLSAMLLIALPVFQYFSRTHLGYVTALLVLAWLAVWRERWGWAGLLFGFAIAAHFIAAVAVGLSLGMLALFYGRLPYWQKWARLMIGLVLPLLFIDFLFFIHNGKVFYWTLGTIGVSARWSSSSSAMVLHPENLLWVVQTVSGSNGVLLSILLATCVMASVLVWRDHKALAMQIAFLFTAIFYTFIAATRESFISRALAPSYPFWAMGAGIVLSWLIKRAPQVILQRIILSALIATLLVSLITAGFFIREFTQTLYPQVEQWTQRAAKEGRPIRYSGNPWVALFFAQANQVEVISGDQTWVEDNHPGQAVLIFEGTAPSGLNRNSYIIEKVSISNWADDDFPVITTEALLKRDFEVWWPTYPSSPIYVDPSRPQGSIVYHYVAKTCLTPPPFENGTMYYYQLVWDRLTKRLGLR